MAHQPLDEAAVAAHWDGNAVQWISDVQAGYDRFREAYTFPAFLDFLPDIAGREVIDLGCGEGSNTRRLAALGARMTGIDIAQRLIAEAHRQEAVRSLGIRYEHTWRNHAALVLFVDAEKS